MDLIRELQATLGDPPRVHPNGFIQLDLTPDGSRRLHVFRHDIPRQIEPTPIHEHAFHMKSRVIRGRLIDLQYNYKVGTQYDRYVAVRRGGHETQQVLVDDLPTVDIIKERMDLVVAGQGYEVPVGVLHETVPLQPTVTIIERGTRLSFDPVVLVRHGRKPSNEFTRTYPLVTLWDIIQQETEGIEDIILSIIHR